jgi:hypothetical protein
MELTEKLTKKLSEVLERDLTGIEKAIVDWTIIQVQFGNLLEEGN